MTDETILSNARLVMSGEVVHGTIRARNGSITDIDHGATAVPGAVDCEGDHVIPGLVELHTDNLERHLEPRPGVDWPEDAALVAHDRELSGTGITTVFDALRVGSFKEGDDYRPYARRLADTIGRLRRDGALRISHHIHLRAEICSETLLDEMAQFGAGDRIGLVSLMDHTPGQRQFRDVEKLRVYHEGKHGSAPGGFERHVARLKDLRARLGDGHERGAVAEARRLGAVLASHDDTTEAQVAVSAGHGVALAEFPTTEEAARACRAAGIPVMMGAPNVIRGGSHSGNVSADALARADLLDILSSDYIPAALLLAAWRLAEVWGDLPRAIATVSATPAARTGLRDRGRLEPGLRADLVRVRLRDGVPLPIAVHLAGAADRSGA